MTAVQHAARLTLLAVTLLVVALCAGFWEWFIAVAALGVVGATVHWVVTGWDR